MIVKRNLPTYELTSGQAVNYNKSMFMTIRNTGREMQEITIRS